MAKQQMLLCSRKSSTSKIADSHLVPKLIKARDNPTNYMNSKQLEFTGENESLNEAREHLFYYFCTLWNTLTSVSTQPRALSHPPGWVLFPSLPVVLIWRALVPHAISCVTSQPTAADSICLYGTPTTRHWTNATLPQFLFASRILFEHENMAQERPRLDTELFGKGADGFINA